MTADEKGKILIGFALGPALQRPNVRLQLLDDAGKILWSGEKLSAVVDGDLGTAAALTGLPPGRYRLHAEGVGGEAALSAGGDGEVGACLRLSVKGRSPTGERR